MNALQKTRLWLYGSFCGGLIGLAVAGVARAFGAQLDQAVAIMAGGVVAGWGVAVFIGHILHIIFECWWWEEPSPRRANAARQVAS